MLTAPFAGMTSLAWPVVLHRNAAEFVYNMRNVVLWPVRHTPQLDAENIVGEGSEGSVLAGYSVGKG